MATAIRQKVVITLQMEPPEGETDVWANQLERLALHLMSEAQRIGQQVPMKITGSQTSTIRRAGSTLWKPM